MLYGKIVETGFPPVSARDFLSTYSYWVEYGILLHQLGDEINTPKDVRIPNSMIYLNWIPLLLKKISHTPVTVENDMGFGK